MTGPAHSGRRSRPVREPDGPGDPADPAADADQVAREIALRQLTVRARSRAELRAALARRQVPDEVAERVLDGLQEVALIDDRDFAGQWVRSRHTQRGLSRRAIRQELRSKGIDDDIAAEALESIDGESEFEAAAALAAKKVRSLGGQPRLVVRRRVAGALSRRGYGADVVARVLGHLDDGDDLVESGPW